MAILQREAILGTPLFIASGDEIRLNGTSLEVWRDGMLISSHPVSVGPQCLVSNIADQDRMVSNFFVVEEQKMPGQNVVLTGVQLNQTSGAVTFKFSNGTNSEYGSVEDAKSSVQYLDTQSKTAEDALILKTFRNSPDATNLENMVGRAMAINFDGIVPFVLTASE